jgi:LPS-assembly protein
MRRISSPQARPSSPSYHLEPLPCGLRRGLVAAACALVCVLASRGGLAQDHAAPEEGLRLKPSMSLQDKLPGQERDRELPTFIFGDRITGRQELETVIDGNAELRRAGSVFRADRIEYEQPSDTLRARGNVRINREGNIFEGKEAQIRIDANEGYFLQPSYRLLRNDGNGQAERVDFVDDKRSVARQATYTTCLRDDSASWTPDWVLQADQVKFDTEANVGEAYGAKIRFKGVTLLSLPYLSFPLSDARKSGLLPPTLNLDNVSGFEATVPYYWNIAPNRDATIYTGVSTRRGLSLGGEFRYLESSYGGTIRADVMPDDRLRNRNRWGLTTSHSGQVNIGTASPVNLSLAINRVSDDNYWRDFPRATGSLTQRLLPSDFQLSWSRPLLTDVDAGSVSLSARALKWQTLQQSDSIITPPYDRMPQVNARYTVSPKGFDLSLEGDHTRFESNRVLTQQPNADRSYALASVSRPFVTPGFYFTPRAQLHSTDYQFDAPLASGTRSANRTVPTLSADSGLVFERSANIFGRDVTQTLEPRALYVYAPFRDQSRLPNYDSGVLDFSFGSIFAESPFVGQDRIADNNLLTLGLTSRMLDPQTGAENLRLAYAQRLRFQDQRVTLPGGTPDQARFSDMLFGAQVNWTPQWSTEGTVQYNPKTSRTDRSVLSARYSPSNYRTVSAAYRFTRNQSEQLDLGWQWPLNDLWGDKGADRGEGRGLGPAAGERTGSGRWYSVGRLNYSLRDRRLVDTIVGLEYDGCCWIGRIVFERLQTTQTSSNKRILFQLEFVGFARLGSSPLRTLRDNVPRYQLLREKIDTAPSRFSNYE